MRRPRKFQRNLRAPKGSAQSAPAVGKFIFNFIGRLRRRDRGPKKKLTVLENISRSNEKEIMKRFCR